MEILNSAFQIHHTSATQNQITMQICNKIFICIQATVNEHDSEVFRDLNGFFLIKSTLQFVPNIPSHDNFIIVPGNDLGAKTRHTQGRTNGRRFADDINANIKAPHCWPFVGGNSRQPIPFTKTHAVMRKMCPWHDVIMTTHSLILGKYP